MRWSNPSRRALGVLALGVALVGGTRARLADRYGRTKIAHEPYLLPPPQQTVVLSLGYRAAAADLIFGHVLVSAGIHLSEKRLFEHGGRYLETVNELDPKFRDPYRLADAILTLQTVPVPDEIQRQARAILLRGTRELPYDQALWASAGQFLAYLAPQRLSDPAEAAAFRQDGARLLARACELIGSNENIPYHCITASNLFSAENNRAAARAFLEKLFVVSDDPAIQKLAEVQLAAIDSEDAQQQRKLRSERFKRAWRDDLPFVSRAAMAALGPAFDPAACAGQRPRAAGDTCSTSFRALLSEP